MRAYVKAVAAVIGLVVAVLTLVTAWIQFNKEIKPVVTVVVVATQQPQQDAPLKGKYPCPLIIRQDQVDSWKAGQASITVVRQAIRNFDELRPNNEGAFTKETRIPGNVLVAMNFDEQDANKWTQYPVIPIIHSGSWGLFQTTGEYTAPNPGACMTIVP